MNLSSRIALVLLVLFFLLPSISMAAETYNVQGRYVCSSNSPTGTSFTACSTFSGGYKTGAELATYWQGRVNGATGAYPTLRPWTFGGRTGECDALYSGRTYAQGAATCFQSYTRTDGYTTNYGFGFVFGCPYGGTRSGSSCINAPDTQFGRDATTGEPLPDPNPPPPPPPACEAGPTQYTGHQYTFDGEPAQGCFNGCTHSLSIIFTAGLASGTTSIAKVGNATGTTCDMNASAGNIPPEAQTPEEKCVSQGLSYGYANGEVMCYQPGVPGAVPTTKTTDQTKTETSASGNTTTTIETTINTTNNAVITTTTTTINNGGTVSSSVQTTEQSKDVYCEENPTASICKDDVIGTIGGTDLPDGNQPFYQSSYPDGINGVWSDFQSAIDQTSFVSAMQSMAPNWSGGACPSWSINVGFGAQELSVPCYVWDVIGIMFIVSALFGARQIIFGG